MFAMLLSGFLDTVVEPKTSSTAQLWHRSYNAKFPKVQDGKMSRVPAILHNFALFWSFLKDNEENFLFSSSIIMRGKQNNQGKCACCIRQEIISFCVFSSSHTQINRIRVAMERCLVRAQKGTLY